MSGYQDLSSLAMDETGGECLKLSRSTCSLTVTPRLGSLTRQAHCQVEIGGAVALPLRMRPSVSLAISLQHLENGEGTLN